MGNEPIIVHFFVEKTILRLNASILISIMVVINLQKNYKRKGSYKW